VSRARLAGTDPWCDKFQLVEFQRSIFGCAARAREMNSLLMLPLADVPVTQWDPPAIIIGKLAVIAALVGLNGFFVACEFAIIKVRASQLDELAEEGNPRAHFIFCSSRRSGFCTSHRIFFCRACCE